MDTTRRGFFGLLASAVTAGVAAALGKKYVPRTTHHITTDGWPFSSLPYENHGYVTATQILQSDAEFRSTYHQKIVDKYYDELYRLREHH